MHFFSVAVIWRTVSAPPGSSSLRAYPLLSVITRQPPNLPPHLPQPSSPGGVPSHLSLLSPQHPRGSEPSPSQTPLSISSESETEHSTPRLKKPRRSRTIFTELQLMGLEKKFQKQKYLSTPDRSVQFRRSHLIGSGRSGFHRHSGDLQEHTNKKRQFINHDDTTHKATSTTLWQSYTQESKPLMC